MSENSLKQAKSQLESIKDLMCAFRTAEAEGEAEWEGEMVDVDYLRETIEEDPLDIEIRSDWHIPGNEADLSTSCSS